jgi:hypothetical protein
MVNTGTGDQRYHRSMSEYPPSGPSAAHGASGYPPAPTGFPGAAAGPPVWPSPSRSSQWPTFLALALALVASGLAIVGWFRPSPPPTAPPSKTLTYTEQQVSDAKARACTALDLVHKGTMLHAGTNVGQSSDPALAEAQGADARLAIISGAWYLRDHLDAATPAELAAAIKGLTQVMLDLGANYLADARNDDPAQSALIKEGNSGFDHALELCK